jgi:type I restriction enzyme S subunit
VDEKITALTAQKTALTQYKQGMMQRIFAQTLRFKDDNGADYPEWDSMRLEELGEFKSGVGFSESEQGGQEGIPFFKVSDMNLSENTFHMNIANHYVTEEQIQKLKLKVIKKDAIIFAKVGAAIFLERKRIAKNFLIDNNMMAFIPKANLLFMKYLFETVQLSKFAQVGALPSYNSSDLGIIKVGLPNSYEEQTKIARFLTECDDKINAVDAQIQSAQQWKQGLLQQMFI